MILTPRLHQTLMQKLPCRCELLAFNYREVGILSAMKKTPINLLASILISSSLIAVSNCSREVPVTVMVQREVEATQEVPVTVVVQREVEVTREKAPIINPSDSITPDQIADSFAEVYGEGDFVQDSNHALICYKVKRFPGHPELATLSALIESYPAGYLPDVFDRNRIYFNQFDFNQIKVWCNGMIQNIEERVLSRSWDLVQRRHHGYEGDTTVSRWPNVATSLRDFGATPEELMNLFDAEEIAILDRIAILNEEFIDPFTRPYEQGDFERDVETWAACIKFIDDRTEDNLDSATIGMNRFLRHYYSEGYSGIEASSVYDKKLKVGTLCLFVKSRIERRAVANLAGKPVPLP